jgi:hypothetical protein
MLLQGCAAAETGIPSPGIPIFHKLRFELLKYLATAFELLYFLETFGWPHCLLPRNDKKTAHHQADIGTGSATGSGGICWQR